MSDIDEESDYMELPLKHKNPLLDSSFDNFSELNDDWNETPAKDQSNDSLTKKVRFEKNDNEGETIDQVLTHSPKPDEKEEQERVVQQEEGDNDNDADDDNQFILHAPGHVRLARNNNFDSDFMLADRSQTSSTVSNKVDVEDLIRAASEVNDYLSQNLDKINSLRSDILSSTDFTRTDHDDDNTGNETKPNSGLLNLTTGNLSGSLSNFELSDNDDSERDSDAFKNYVLNRENMLSSSTSVGSHSDFGWKNRNSSTSLSKLLNTANFEESGLLDVKSELFRSQEITEFNLKELLEERKHRLETERERAEEERKVENFESSTMLVHKYLDENAEFPEVETEKALDMFKENIELMIKISETTESLPNHNTSDENHDNTNEQNGDSNHDESESKVTENGLNASPPETVCTMEDVVIKGKYEFHTKEVLNFTMKSTPSLSAQSFLQRIQSKCNFGAVIYLTAAYLLQILVLTRDSPDKPVRIRLRLRRNEVHRLIIATMRVATKLVEDFVHSHEYFSKVCGISKKLLSKLEVSLVMCIKNEELMITNGKLAASFKILDELKSSIA